MVSRGLSLPKFRLTVDTFVGFLLQRVTSGPAVGLREDPPASRPFLLPPPPPHTPTKAELPTEQADLVLGLLLGPPILGSGDVSTDLLCPLKKNVKKMKKANNAPWAYVMGGGGAGEGLVVESNL